MQVPLLDLKAQLVSIKDEMYRQIEDVIESAVFINGPKVAELEERIASYSGCDHAIGVSSGTDALLVALMALDVGPGDIVITTPYSFFASAGAISRLGARPAFVDIDPESFNLSPANLRRWFADHPQEAARVKAIIPVHLYGQCADMDPILDLARERQIPIVEDAAQAIGATYEGKKGSASAGSMGDVGCFSFFPSKNLGGLGDGGMVVTGDACLADRIRKLRSHGAHPKYYHALIGGNFRLDAIQAAALLTKLPHLEDWHGRRRANARRYDEALSGLEGIKTPKVEHSRECHIYNQYVVRAEQRDELRAFLSARKIGTEVYYPVPFHKQECFAYLGYSDGDFPEAEEAAECTVALPIYPEMTIEMQDYVVGSIGEFYG